MPKIVKKEVKIVEAPTAESNPEAFIALQIEAEMKKAADEAEAKIKLARIAAEEKIRARYEDPEAKAKLLREAALISYKTAVTEAEKALFLFDAEFEPKRDELVVNVKATRTAANAFASTNSLPPPYPERKASGKISIETFKTAFSLHGGKATTDQIAEVAGLTQGVSVKRWFDHHRATHNLTLDKTGREFVYSFAGDDQAGDSQNSEQTEV